MIYKIRLLLYVIIMLRLYKYKYNLMCKILTIHNLYIYFCL